MWNGFFIHGILTNRIWCNLKQGLRKLPRRPGAFDFSSPWTFDWDRTIKRNCVTELFWRLSALVIIGWGTPGVFSKFPNKGPGYQEKDHLCFKEHSIKVWPSICSGVYFYKTLAFRIRSHPDQIKATPPKPRCTRRRSNSANKWKYFGRSWKQGKFGIFPLE